MDCEMTDLHGKRCKNKITARCFSVYCMWQLSSKEVYRISEQLLRMDDSRQIHGSGDQPIE